jgi:hypothetical protein
MKRLPPASALYAPSLLIVGALILGGCAGSSEDVRVSYCKNLAGVLLAPGETVQWGAVGQEIHRPEYAAISLRQAAGEGQSAPQAECRYAYTAPEENVMTQTDPLSAYATVPYQVSVNGTTLSEKELRAAQVFLLKQQGKKLAEQAEQEARLVLAALADKLRQLRPPQ